MTASGPVVGAKAYSEIGAASGGNAFSADGAFLYQLRTPGLAQVWSLDLGTGASAQLTAHDETVAFLRRAPKDDRLLYGIDAGGDERQQLWLIEGGTARPLTAAPDAIHDPGVFSPDGAKIAFAANDRDPVRFDVKLLDLATGASTRLMEGPGLLSVAGWSPDGTTLAVIEERSFGDTDIHLLPVAGGAGRRLPAHGAARYQSVRWAADGGSLLCLTDQGGRDVLALCRLDLATGVAALLADAPDADIEAWALAATGGLLATVENRRGVSVLRVAASDATMRPAVDGLPQGVIADLAFAPDGSRLAFNLSTSTRPGATWVWEASTRTARPVFAPALPAGLDGDGFVPVAPVSWPAADGREIPGFFAPPRTAPPPGGHPAVIWVHGGPAAQTRPGFRADMQSLLAQGYAVLMPNVRGSTGYGRAYAESDDGAARPAAVADLAAGARFLGARDDIDASRIAVMGQSYGGYMVLAAMGEYPELWRCGVDFYGIADFNTLLAHTGPWRRDHRALEYGDPDRDPGREAALFDRISPIRRVDAIRAPLLVLHAERDPRVPFGESEQIVAALQERQRRVEFVRFDYAGHGFLRPAHRARAFEAVTAFLARTL